MNNNIITTLNVNNIMDGNAMNKAITTYRHRMSSATYMWKHGNMKINTGTVKNMVHL